MKRYISFAVFLLLACSLFACSTDTEVANTENVTMTAVINNLDGKFEVDVIDGAYGASGLYWINISDNAILIDENGNPISKSEFEIGDIVEITYDGKVMLSYPPQVVALKIQIK